MTKKIKTVSVLSSIVSQLYTFALLALGVALLVTHYTQDTLLGVLYSIDKCYIALASAVGIDKWIVVLATTIVPAVLLEVFAFVQTFSPKLKVDIAMILLTVIVMALCSIIWVMMIVALLALSDAIMYIAIVVAPEIVQLVVLVVLLVCQVNTKTDTAPQTVEPAEGTEAQSAEVQIVEPTLDTEVDPQEEPAESDTIELNIPYQPRDTMSTVEILSSIYGEIDTTAPIHNEVLVKIDKLVQYRKLGLITADECDMLSSNILRESTQNIDK